MKAVKELEQNVTCIEQDGREFVLVGTAHVSKSSAELVERILGERKPDTVCLELCAARLESLKNPDSWRNTDIFRVIKDGKLYVLMAQIVLAAFQKRLAKQLGIRPGEEMRRALELATAAGQNVSVVDRDIRTTLKRAWADTGILGFSKIIASLLEGLFSKEQMGEAQIEELKKGDALTAVMSEFSEVLPGVKKVLIDERDRYMAAKIAASPGRSVVAVLGAGHIPGIVAAFGEPIDLSELEALPPPSKWKKAFVWLFPAILVVFIIAGFFHSGMEGSLRVIAIWAICNMIGAAIGAAAAFGHPLTVLSAFFSAPVAAIHPVIAVGGVGALVEAFMRKPRVLDFETLAEDISSASGLWRNRVSRIFLIFILANLGSVAGSAVGLALAARGF